MFFNIVLALTLLGMTQLVIMLSEPKEVIVFVLAFVAGCMYLTVSKYYEWLLEE
tara:strand:+ start:1746 stop:1907 length:162 start_codon:yes stop_codon:yes gene_type:complete